MRKLTSTQAMVYTVVVFLLTTGLSFWLRGYSITIGGFLLGIFLTTFIANKKSTLVAAAVSILIVILINVFHEEVFDSATGIANLAFILLLIVFTALIVIHIKKLSQDISFDKNHMTSLFENATEGIILTNRAGKMVLINPAAEKIFGYTAEEIIGQPIEILVPKKYREGHVNLREGFQKAPQDRVMGHGRDLHGTKKNGENFPVEVSLSYYKRNNEPFVIAFIVDITARKEIEANMLRQQQELENVTRDIRKLNAQLEAKVEERTVILKEALMKLEQSQKELSEALDKERQLNEIKSRFVSMASHEFRTPLSTILSSASLLGKYLTTEDQSRRDKHIHRIKDSVKHLNDILEDFLNLGRLDEGKINAQHGSFNLPELISDTTEEMKGLLRHYQNIIYNHEGSEEVYSDKKLLKNVLINLMTNAIKFSAEGASVQVNSSVENGQATVSVSDKGIGISEEDQEHLFSSFFRGKNAMNIQGTGLGLHIVKRYIDLLDGSVQLESRLNEGTTVTFSIPVNHNI
ncbi:MAG TPA: ATP-binding protein [Flavitalea sp.]|nr:ATP-binding protein [Flavitalea sp.]